jgi:hypothetical protein
MRISRHSRVGLAFTIGCSLGLLAVPLAQADDVIGTLPAASAVAAYGGDVAWWTPGAGGYRLTLRAHGVTSSPAAVPASSHPENLTAGPDARGRAVFLYTSCGAQTTNCVVYRYTPATGRRQRLAHVPAGTIWAAQWRTRLVFAKAGVVRGVGGAATCDVP